LWRAAETKKTSVLTYLSHFEPKVPRRPEHFALADAHWEQAVPHFVVWIGFARIIMS
jgi:hypothetical protein